MTGFARVDGSAMARHWTWELRSVNGRGLDLRLRLPTGFDHLERPVRDRTAAVVGRGNLQASLVLQRDSEGAELHINEVMLDRLIETMKRIGGDFEFAPPRLDGLLAVRGVVEVVETELDEDQRNRLSAELLASFDAALAALVAARREEGEAVARAALARVDDIERLTRAAEDCPARSVDAIRARLAEQVAMLLEASPALDPVRLHQEAALLATKVDIREEIDRLHAHVAAARALFAAGGPIGRRLDFLAQEFNREVNTLCSKSNDRSLTAIGLDLKATVDQLREQIQNLE
jgi:uncharacterized protein (TIGR00255 family)